MIFQVYFSIVIIITIITFLISLYAYKWRTVTGGKVYSLLLFVDFLLVFSELLSMISTNSNIASFWYNLRIFFLSAISILWFVFVCQYFHKPKWIQKKTILILLIFPLFANVVHYFFPTWHLWLIQDNTLNRIDGFWIFNTATRIPGVLLFGFVLYCSLLLIAGVAIILSNFLRYSYRQKWIAVMLILGAIIPIMTSLTPLFVSFSKPNFDWMLIGICISIIFQTIAIFLGLLRKGFVPEPIDNWESFPKQQRGARNAMIIISIMVASSIAALGIVSYKAYERQYRSQVENQLSSISLLKAAEIQKWRDERESDASYLLNNDSFGRLIEIYLSHPDDLNSKNLIQSFLVNLRYHDEYVQIGLLDPQSQFIFSEDQNSYLPVMVKAKIAQTFEKGDIEFIDFFRDNSESPILLSMLIPFYTSEEQKPLAIVFINIDPKIYLYPMILQWPIPSQTGETAIVRDESDKVLYLSNLRFLDNAALTTTIPYSEYNRPSVMAVKGQIGVVEGINYRDHKVIADVRPIFNSPWYLVTRIDQEEVFIPLDERGRLSWVLYSSLIIFSLIGMISIWRQQVNQAVSANSQLQGEIAERDRKLKEAQELAHLGFWYWDVKTGTVEWSEEVYKIFRLDPEKFKPDIESISKLSPWLEDNNRGQELISRAISTRQPGMYEQKFLRPDQSIGFYSSTFQGVFDETDQLIAIIGSIIDITERTRQEQALRESEKRFRTLFEHAAVGVLILNPYTGRVLDVNQKFCELVEYTKEELLEKKIQSLSPAKYQKTYQKKSKALLDGKIREFVLEKQYLRKNGESVWVSQSVSSLWEKSEISKEPQFISMEVDITEQKKIEMELRESEQKFKETIENLDEGYYRCTLDGIILDHNPSYAKIMGIPDNKNMIGISTPDYWKYPKKRKDYLENLIKHRTVTSYQIEAIKFTGEEITILISSHLIYDNTHQPIQIEGVILDITPRIIQEEKIISTQKELQRLLDQAEKSRKALLNIVEDQKIAQQEIRRLNITLEERVEKRTTELKTSNEELESFAYSVSHDLRAPLRAIDGYSRIFEQDYGHLLDQEGQRLLSIIRNSTKNMDDLITDILMLSRVGRSELKIHPTNMTELVKSIIEEMSSPEIMKKVTFKVQDLPKSRADLTLIRQVWTNLISNAIKYSLPKENPVIQISGFRDLDANIYSVKDNGVGFNPDHKDKLFGLFQRLHKASEFEGTGVGLAIVQRIVRRHGGQVFADGEIGVGATFSFTIPLGEDEID